jgi:DNA polymerase epsilon subunit 1
MANRAGKTFGLTSSYNTRERGSFNRRGRGGFNSARGAFKTQDQQDASAKLVKGAFDDGTSAEDRFREAAAQDEIDAKMGFERLDQGPSREAWLVNMHPTIIADSPLAGPIHSSGRSAVDFYFIQDDASMFKVTIPYQPYFLVGCRPGTEGYVEDFLRRKYEATIATTSREQREDLKLPNHLAGLHREYVKVNFHNINDLMTVRRDIQPLALKAQMNKDAVDTYTEALQENEESQFSASMAIGLESDQWMGNKAAKGKARAGHTRLDPEECINDLREYDIPYYLRVAIDKGECVLLRDRVTVLKRISCRYPSRTLVQRHI